MGLKKMRECQLDKPYVKDIFTPMLLYFDRGDVR